MSCKHEDFATTARVVRLEDSGRFMLELGVKCTQCDQPFHFVGVKRGLSMSGPSGSVDLTELRIPIAPGDAFPMVRDPAKEC